MEDIVMIMFSHIKTNNPDNDFKENTNKYLLDYFVKKENASLNIITNLINKCNSTKEFNDFFRLIINLSHNIRTFKLKNIGKDLNFFNLDKKKWVKKIHMYINR
jgi:hypothetical protein